MTHPNEQANIKATCTQNANLFDGGGCKTQQHGMKNVQKQSEKERRKTTARCKRHGKTNDKMNRIVVSRCSGQQLRKVLKATSKMSKRVKQKRKSLCPTKSKRNDDLHWKKGLFEKPFRFKTIRIPFVTHAKAFGIRQKR